MVTFWLTLKRIQSTHKEHDDFWYSFLNPPIRSHFSLSLQISPVGSGPEGSSKREVAPVQIAPKYAAALLRASTPAGMAFSILKDSIMEIPRYFSRKHRKLNNAIATFFLQYPRKET